MSDINKEDLEKEVEKAIKEKRIIKNFDSRSIEECKYIQKCAEVYFSLYGVQVSVASLFIAIGITYIILSIQDNRMWLTAIAGSILFLIGVSLPFVSPTYLAKSKLGSCRRIILDAEKRIQSNESPEPELPQEANNISSQTQKNNPSKDYIKAWLDLLKIVIGAIIVAILGFAAYYLQSKKPDVTIVLVAMAVLALPLFISGWLYRKAMDRLKDLP